MLWQEVIPLVRLDLHTEDVLARLDTGVSDALDAAGNAAVAAVREQMLHGYGEPIVRTGALLHSISHSVEGNTLHVGSPLSYAEPVHDGALHTSGRPFLQDSLMGSLDRLHDAMAEAFHQAMT